MTLPHDPTQHETARISGELVENPCARASYYSSPEEERTGFATSCYFGVVARGMFQDVWTYDDECNLSFEGSFRSLSAARSFAEQRAAETQQGAEEYLQSQKVEEWRQRTVSMIELKAPFVFTDNTDYRHGWRMAGEEAAFAFFTRHEALFLESTWSDAYTCEMVDTEGTPCWVVRGPEGQMLLEACQEENE